MNSTGILFGAPKTGVSYFIPNEVVLHIFGFLPEPDLVVASTSFSILLPLSKRLFSLEKTLFKRSTWQGKTVEVISEIQGNRLQAKSP